MANLCVLRVVGWIGWIIFPNDIIAVFKVKFIESKMVI